MLLLSLAFLALAAPPSFPARTTAPATAGPKGSELRAAAAFEAARKQGPLALHAFLQQMPKGADLHMHLSGAIYAETFLKDAVEDGLCIDTARLALVRPAGHTCTAGTVAAAEIMSAKNPGAQALYDAMIDSFSLRTFVPKTGMDGHDQFFNTFERFGAFGKAHTGEWLDEVATRASAQNEQYLEIMNTPTFSHAAALGAQFGWPTALHPQTTAASSEPDDLGGTSRAELSALRDKLLAAGLRDEVAVDRAEFDQALAERRRLEHCDTPAALPACTVRVEWIYQVLRAFPPQQVFAQTLLGFEVASADPDVVGINFVQPEDDYRAMSEYRRQMRMLDYLHSVYPRVHISLHAGELSPGMVPPAGLAFHIHQAVDLGHAERIGHGVDAMYETDPHELMQQLATKHIMVEINLTSNDVILGISPPNHPLLNYRAAHVPVSLNTDDEGVSRIDLTHEYVVAATEFGLNYQDLKQMVRTGMEHTFLPGASLWAKPDDFTRVVGACASSPLGSDAPGPACGEFLKVNPRAAQQWELEKRSRHFEAMLH